jgi:site-specific recombinase XerD
MSYQIWKIRVRQELKHKREPYWTTLGLGRHLGIRVLEDGRMTWVAKFRNRKTGERKQDALGEVCEAFEYDAAKVAAEAYFNLCENGVSSDDYTVEDACRALVEEHKANGKLDCAADMDMRFRQLIYKAWGPYTRPFGLTRLRDLTRDDLVKWRAAGGVAKSSQNRRMQPLWSALLLAMKNKKGIGEEKRAVLKVVDHHRADGRRKLYLNMEQRRAWIDACEPSVKKLLEGAFLTGARPGELARAPRSHFNATLRVMTFIGKTGEREVQLSPAAYNHFKALSEAPVKPTLTIVQKDGEPVSALAFRRAKALRAGLPLYTHDGKNFWADSNWSKQIREAAERAGLPKGACMYTARHCYITDMIRGGMNIFTVAKIVGTSVLMIQKHYGHLVPDEIAETMARVATL